MSRIFQVNMLSKNFIKKTFLIGAVATSTLLTASCRQRNSLQEDYVEFYVETKANKPLDFSKPNLPILIGEKTIYKNSEGDVVVLDKRDEVLSSIYKAIEMHSTDKTPDIEAPELFYVDVQKNILMGSPENGNLFKFSKCFRELQVTLLFNKLYDMFTSSDSDKGKTISVKEYTQMMDSLNFTKSK